MAAWRISSHVNRLRRAASTLPLVDNRGPNQVASDKQKEAKKLTLGNAFPLQTITSG
jgi:hypothetical protein